ncbi:hypothetical protein ACQ86G_29035 [Roseateles chitinivorans]|uniref:hypothetical protein n=1 Tax=Roseateles chitinivorans TaxID=2917965 RepID=UPI003D67F008
MIGGKVRLLNPVSSCGLTHALESGRLGALAIDAALEGEQRLLEADQRTVEWRADEYDIARRGFYAVESRWPEARFWTRRRVSKW